MGHPAFLISYLNSQIADFGLLRHAAKDETMTVNIKGTPGTNCIKIVLPGKLILSKSKGLS